MMIVVTLTRTRHAATVYSADAVIMNGSVSVCLGQGFF